jgi:AraC-like DNA-binding protein
MPDAIGSVADVPPEYCQYQDEGCDLAASCLNCPLPVCVHDEPGGKHRLLKQRRTAEIARLRLHEKKSVAELARIFGVSTRTVQRALREGREKPVQDERICN